MSPNQIIENAKKEFSKAEERLRNEVNKLRTGRAHPSMVENVHAVAYGTPMPLIQLATITTPEPQLIQISPFDQANMQAIAEAIRNDQSLGLNPTDDGRVIRVPIPPLTTERRTQIVKQLHEKVEECYIAMRQARHDGIKSIKEAGISQDEQARVEKQVDDLMAKQKAEIEQLAKAKEAEIMTV